MKVAFVDELSKSLSESELWQAIEHKMSFYFFLTRHKRTKISSCVVKRTTLRCTPAEMRKYRKRITMKDLRDLQEDIDILETALGSLYRIAAEEVTMSLSGARRWNSQTELLDSIMDAIRQDAEMLSEDSSES